MQVLALSPDKMMIYAKLILKQFYLGGKLLIIIFALGFFYFLLQANQSFNCPYP